MALLYEKETYKIRGACFKVWNHFGGAFKESIIDKALTKELLSRGLKIEDQKRLDIYYRGEKMGTYVPDKIVNEAILIELKCKPQLTKGDIDRFWKYLKGSDYKLGLLINFRPSGLEFRRIIYDRARYKKSKSA